MNENELVTIYQSYDTIGCRMLVDFLNHSGVEAFFLGSLVGASVGLGEVIVQARIDVHPRDEAQARELITSYEADYLEEMLKRPWELQDDAGDGDAPVATEATTEADPPADSGAA